LYLLRSSGAASTFSINCGIGGKWIFNAEHLFKVLQPAHGALYGSHAHSRE